MSGNTQVTIEKIEVQAIRLPMTEPHRTASGVVSESPLVLTEIHTSEGVVGRSIVFTFTAMSLKAVAEMVKGLNPLLEQKPLTPSAVNDQLMARFRMLGTQGLVGIAIAAVDMALWDAHAKLHQSNLVTLLGGEAKSIPAYGAVGFDGEKGSAETAAYWVEQGFPGVKAKIGYADIAEEVRVVNAIRAAVGPDIHIMVDYNQCLTPSEAIERIKRLNDAGLTWVEEPTLAHDYLGHNQVNRASVVPVQSGENWWQIQDVQHALDADASEYIMLDVMKVGGVSGWLKAAALCGSRQVRVSSHLWPEVSAQLLSVTPNHHWLEYCDWWNQLLQKPLELVNGHSHIGDTVGIGMDWKPEVAEKYRI